MDNNQNNNEPVLQPMNENGQNNVQPALQPNNVPTGDTSQTGPTEQKEEVALHTRMIQDEKASPQINLEAYNKAQEKKEKEQKTFTEDPHAGAKRFFGMIILLLILGFAIFLPNISDKLDEYKLKKANENLTEGQLRCKTMKNTDSLRIDYTQSFKFFNNQITTYKYEEEYTGSREEAKELEKIDTNCRLLDKETSEVTGVSITCSITSTSATVTQEFNLEKLDESGMKTAFSEAGGTLPEFGKGEDVNSVEKKLKDANYKCEKLA